MKKILSITLVLAMLFSALLGVTSFAADEEPAKLDIKSANIEFASTVYLLIAVDYTGVYADEAAALAGVKLTVNGTELTPDAALTADESTPDNTVAFKYTKLSAQEMGDELEIKAFKGNEEQDSLWYSVLEYTICAKSLYSDDALLMAVIDAMLNFGAEAQKVFLAEGETVATKYDFDLAKEHGIAIVGGATAESNKILAEVGTTVSPVAKNTNASDLYDIHFNKVAGNAIAISNGYNRYFFYGSYYGNTDKSGVNMNWYTGDTVKKNYHYIEGTEMTTADKETTLNVENGVMTVQNSARVSGSGMFSISGSNKVADVNNISKKFTADSLVEVGPGYFWIKTIKASTSSLSSGYNVNNNDIKTSNYITNDGCITICFSLAAVKGAKLVANAPRFRGSEGTSDVWYPYKTPGNSTTRKIGIGASYNNYIVTLKDVDVLNGEVPTAEDFTTFYLVFDPANATVTAYTEDGRVIKDTMAGVPAASNYTSLSEWFGQNAYVNWSVGNDSGAIIVNKIIYMNGNIFE